LADWPIVSGGSRCSLSTAFLFPILLKDIGTTTVLVILVGASLLGAWLTSRYAIETTGVNLETLEAAGSEAA